MLRGQGSALHAAWRLFSQNKTNHTRGERERAERETGEKLWKVLETITSGVYMLLLCTTFSIFLINRCHNKTCKRNKNKNKKRQTGQLTCSGFWREGRGGGLHSWAKPPGTWQPNAPTTRAAPAGAQAALRPPAPRAPPPRWDFPRSAGRVSSRRFPHCAEHAQVKTARHLDSPALPGRVHESSKRGLPLPRGPVARSQARRPAAAPSIQVHRRRVPRADSSAKPLRSRASAPSRSGGGRTCWELGARRTTPSAGSALPQF